MCLCSGLFCFVACCWVSRAARVLFYGSPLNFKQDLFAGCGPCVFGLHLCGCCVWGGVLCENCIVDANAIKKATIIIVVVCFFFFVVLFLVFFVVCA